MTTSKKLPNTFYFFIGTEAEFIKVFPVIKEFERRNIPFHIIASGQNNLKDSLVFSFINHKTADSIISDTPIPQTSLGLLFWFIRTFVKGSFMLKRLVKKQKRRTSILIVHGDTVSTVMGALLGKLLGMRIAHLEAGLRSFSWRQPFPEEIDRLIVSRLADIQFSPNAWALSNLKEGKAQKVNTKENTLIESLHYALTEKKLGASRDNMPNRKYFLFVLHRQENLMNKKLITYLISDFLLKQTSLQCVFVMHGFTKEMLEKYGLLSAIQNNKHITILGRVPYPEFMQVIKHAEYIITDGGSNQEECYYLGVPTLLLRNVTERIEGLDTNVVISKLDLLTMKEFIKNYRSYRYPPITVKVKPSVIVADYLMSTI